MPFGMYPACWVFTKLTNELVGHWRSQGIKLDDFLFAVAGDANGGHSLFNGVQQRVLSDIPAAGFSLSIPKLVLAPQKSVKFLGYIVDLGAKRLTVDPSRVLKLKAILGRLLASPRRLHVKDLARVTGMLQSMHLAVGQSVRIFTRCLYDLMGQKPLHVWNWHLALNEGGLSELQFWQANFDRLHGAPLWLDPHVQTVLFTDAGAQGWGGFLVEHGKGQTLQVPSTLKEYYAAGGSLVAQGYLNPIEQLQSSTWREWWPLLRARNGASCAPYVVDVRCLNVIRQADVFLPGPGSANTIVVGAPKWAVYALRRTSGKSIEHEVNILN